MIRVLWLLRRRPDISFEQFRDHYENSHAMLGEKYLGHLLLAYRRNYVLPAGPVPAPDASLMQRVFAAKEWDYDCITEWELQDEATFAQALAIIADPQVASVFHADEEHFLDRSSVRLVRCERRQSDLSACMVPVLDVAHADIEAAEGPWKL